MKIIILLHDDISEEDAIPFIQELNDRAGVKIAYSDKSCSGECGSKCINENKE